MSQSELVGAMHKQAFDDLCLNLILAVEAKVQKSPHDQILIKDSGFSAAERRALMVVACKGMRIDGYLPIIRGSMIMWEDRSGSAPIALRSLPGAEDVVSASDIEEPARTSQLL